MIDGNFARLFGNELVVFLVIIALLFGSAELGFRLGLRLHRANDTTRKAQIGGVQTAVLGLLGLLLGFTLAMAVQRYDTRRRLVVQEANAIGTTYLRTSLLPDAHQTPVKDLLRRYLDLRLKYWPQADDPAKFAEGRRLFGEVEDELWKHATEASKEAPNGITAKFIESLNVIIDTDAERTAAMRGGIPSGVWLLVVTVAVFGCVTTSYRAGSEGARSKLVTVFLPLLITVVIVLIFDISHSRIGLIKIDQEALQDLQQTIQGK